MKKKLFVEDWERREHFNFFSQFEEPFYGVCVRVDSTTAHQYSKANGINHY